VKRLNLLLANLTVKNYLAALLLSMKLSLEWSGVLVVAEVEAEAMATVVVVEAAAMAIVVVVEAAAMAIVEADMATIVAEEMVAIEGLAGNIKVILR
jgi:hypothetical protein